MLCCATWILFSLSPQSEVRLNQGQQRHDHTRTKVAFVKMELRWNQKLWQKAKNEGELAIAIARFALARSVHNQVHATTQMELDWNLTSECDVDSLLRHEGDEAIVHLWWKQRQV
ncbi:hypothetical protein VNO78_10141 [Psophocarpus tetragonolobus]|uniref:Uncharacterized protein n=1 Tax=Psophocarpus tetragonolobus TaxID=3891 RepID=A0AAN9SJN9_PSOTE